MRKLFMPNCSALKISLQILISASLAASFVSSTAAASTAQTQDRPSLLLKIEPNLNAVERQTPGLARQEAAQTEPANPLRLQTAKTLASNPPPVRSGLIKPVEPKAATKAPQTSSHTAVTDQASPVSAWADWSISIQNTLGSWLSGVTPKGDQRTNLTLIGLATTTLFVLLVTLLSSFIWLRQAILAWIRATQQPSLLYLDLNEGAWPKLSIVVATHNAERDLTETLHRLVHLRYPHDLLNVIVVDHHSSDRSLDIARRFAAQWPSRIHVTTALVEAPISATGVTLASALALIPKTDSDTAIIMMTAEQGLDDAALKPLLSPLFDAEIGMVVARQVPIAAHPGEHPAIASLRINQQSSVWTAILRQLDSLEHITHEQVNQAMRAKYGWPVLVGHAVFALRRSALPATSHENLARYIRHADELALQLQRGGWLVTHQLRAECTTPVAENWRSYRQRLLTTARQRWQLARDYGNKLLDSSKQSLWGRLDLWLQLRAGYFPRLSITAIMLASIHVSLPASAPDTSQLLQSMQPAWFQLGYMLNVIALPLLAMLALSQLGLSMNWPSASIALALDRGADRVGSRTTSMDQPRSLSEQAVQGGNTADLGSADNREQESIQANALHRDMANPSSLWVLPLSGILSAAALQAKLSPQTQATHDQATQGQALLADEQPSPVAAPTEEQQPTADHAAPSEFDQQRPQPQTNYAAVFTTTAATAVQHAVDLTPAAPAPEAEHLPTQTPSQAFALNIESPPDARLEPSWQTEPEQPSMPAEEATDSVLYRSAEAADDPLGGLPIMAEDKQTNPLDNPEQQPARRSRLPPSQSSRSRLGQTAA